MSDPSDCDSLNSVVVIIDGPTDYEVRPCRPSLLPTLQAEREKIKRYQAMMEEHDRKGQLPPQHHG
jgi:hypothetical protein